MNTARIDATLATMTADEIADGLWIVSVCERFGTMDRAEADELRRRIEARQRSPGRLGCSGCQEPEPCGDEGVGDDARYNIAPMTVAITDDTAFEMSGNQAVIGISSTTTHFKDWRLAMIHHARPATTAARTLEPARVSTNMEKWSKVIGRADRRAPSRKHSFEVDPA